MTAAGLNWAFCQGGKATGHVTWWDLHPAGVNDPLPWSVLALVTHHSSPGSGGRGGTGSIPAFQMVDRDLVKVTQHVNGTIGI